MKKSEMLKKMLDLHFNPPESIRNMCDGGQQAVQMVYLNLQLLEEHIDIEWEDEDE